MGLNKEKISKIINAHRKELEDKYKIKTIALFGSYVRGEQTKNSDVDFLVEYTEVVGLFHILATENYLSAMLGVKTDVIPKNNIRKELKKEILSEATLI